MAEWLWINRYNSLETFSISLLLEGRKQTNFNPRIISKSVCVQIRCLWDTAEDYTMAMTSLRILDFLDQSNSVSMNSPIFIGRENPKCSDSHQPAFYSLMANRKPSSISPLSVHCKLWTKRSKCARNCGINSATWIAYKRVSTVII